MKLCILILLFQMNVKYLEAQANNIPEPELTKEQQWVFDKTSHFIDARGNNASSALFLKNYSQLLASNAFCRTNSSPSVNIRLEGRRINENNTLLEWIVTGDSDSAVYVIERRFKNKIGDLDSIGLLIGRGKNQAFRSYSFTDKNDFPGQSWYRLRRIGQNDEIKKIVDVEGYDNTVRVFPNPATPLIFQVEVVKFKTDENTTLVITDTKGSVVYTQGQVFQNGNKVFRLQDLKLPQGTYYVSVSNAYNKGGTTFIIR